MSAKGGATGSGGGVACETCGGRGEVAEWVEAMPSGVSECHVCNGTGLRAPTPPVPTETGGEDLVTATVPPREPQGAPGNGEKP